MKCTEKTEVWSRVCGFFRPVAQWNKGKKEEYKDRTPFKPEGHHGDSQAD
ncbi:MAG: anaerobic ribonucleoside-triphosphate reductase [Desulfuromonadales bacterium]|nr:anaerobic ribonucleoside-triphosphate reductase [Desulfuromonadales bacterium]